MRCQDQRRQRRDTRSRMLYEEEEENYNEQGPYGQYSSYIKRARKREMATTEVQGVTIDNEEE
jgi:hypothetical protein